jgi:hypothetical protein
MKTIVFSSKARGPKEMRVETDGCVVHIAVGVLDEHGTPITYVSVEADGNRHQGGPEWWVANGSKVEPSGVGLRVVQKPRVRMLRSKRSKRS